MAMTLNYETENINILFAGLTITNYVSNKNMFPIELDKDARIELDNRIKFAISREKNPEKIRTGIWVNGKWQIDIST